MSRRGAVIVRVAGELRFLPAAAVAHIVPAPPIARVPGGAPELAGIAEVDNQIVPVVDVRAPSEAHRTPVLVVCMHVTERLGVVVGDVVGVGHYDAHPEAPESVIVGTERAAPLDLGAVYSRLQAGAPARFG